MKLFNKHFIGFFIISLIGLSSNEQSFLFIVVKTTDSIHFSLEDRELNWIIIQNLDYQH